MWVSFHFHFSFQISPFFICTICIKKWSVPVQNTARPSLSVNWTQHLLCILLQTWPLTMSFQNVFKKERRESRNFKIPLSFRAILMASLLFPSRLAHLTVDGSLQLRVAGFIELDSWKEVLDQAQEERLVFIDLKKQNRWGKAGRSLDFNHRCPAFQQITAADTVTVAWFSVRLTSFDKFMSLRTLITIVDSVSLGLARLAAPNVRRTDRIFRRPKS